MGKRGGKVGSGAKLVIGSFFTKLVTGYFFTKVGLARYFFTKVGAVGRVFFRSRDRLGLKTRSNSSNIETLQIWNVMSIKL